MVVGLRPDAAAMCDNRLQNQRGYCYCYESVFFIFERPRQREAVEEDRLLSFCNAPRNNDCNDVAPPAWGGTTGDGGLFVCVVSEVAPIHPRH